MSEQNAAPQYEWQKTAKKGLYVFLAIMAALAAFVEAGDLAGWNWTASTAVAVAFASAKVGLNFLKHKHPDVIPAWLAGLVPVLLLCVILAAGCATTARTTFTEIVAPDGTVQTQYDAKAKAAPFGELNEGIFNLGYRWGGTENDLAVGQTANGLDNTNQTAALATALAGANEALANLTGIIQQLATSGVLAPKPADNVTEVQLNLPALEALGLKGLAK